MTDIVTLIAFLITGAGAVLSWRDSTRNQDPYGLGAAMALALVSVCMLMMLFV